jgi:hypothetical protein
MRVRVGHEGGPGPFEVIQLPFLFLGGVSTLTNLGVPTSLSLVLDQPLLTIWCVLMCIGSAVAFIGVLWQGREATALMIEEIGLIAVVGVALIYIVALLSQLGHVQGVFVVTTFVGGLGVQSAWRIVDIFRFQRKLVGLSQILEDEAE